MATYFRLLDVGRQFFDDNGDPLNGGKLYTYEAGTTTSKTTYQDDAGATPHANPIILDSAGRPSAEVWGTTGGYKLKLDNSLDSTIWTRDDVIGFNDTAETSASEWIASGLTPTYVSATSFTFAGDQTTVYHVGRRIKTTDTGGTDYATITASSYSNPNTTLTVNVDGAGSLDSGLSAVQYSLISRVNSSITGEWTSVAYSAANFTATGGGTWTTDAAGDQLAYAYIIIGNTMIVNYSIATTDVAGTVSAVNIAIPASKVATKAMVSAVGRCLDAGVVGDAFARVAAGGTVIIIARQDGVAFTATSSDNTSVSGTMVIEID